MKPDRDASVEATLNPFQAGEESYRRLFEVEPDAVFLIDTVSERFLDANPAALKFYGYTREEFLSLKVSGISAEPEKSSKSIAAGDKHVPLRWHRKKDGTIFPVEIVGSYFDYQGRKIHVAAIRDITKQKLAEELLRESEERYRSLFEHMSEGCAYCRMIFENGRPVDWIYLSVNKTFADLTGLEDVVGKSVLEVIPGIRESDPELFELYARVSLTGKPEKCEMFVKALQEWYSVSAFCPEKNYFVVVFEVVTKRKQAEIALRKSENLFSKAFHASPIAMTISSLTDRRIIDVNESFERQTGYAREEVIGKTPREKAFLIDHQEMEQFAQILDAGERIRNLECSFRARSGELLNAIFSAEIVEIAGEPCLLTVAEDVTERKHAALALQASEERFRQMFDHMGSGMVVYDVLGDGDDFIIKEFNPAAEQIGKISRAEVVGRPVLQSFPALKDIGLFETFQRVWRTGIPENHPTSLYSDGRLVIWVENYVFKLPSGEIVAIINDITEKKRVDAFRAELTHASRLAAMGALASGIAHEINQPLSIMAAWAEVAAREIREHLTGDKQEALLALLRIDTAIERSSDIIQHMKNFARKSEPRVAQVRLEAAIEEVHVLLEHQLRISGVILTLDLDSALPPVLVDRTQVQQVFMNLILNAVEALETTDLKSRRVEISAKLVDGMLRTSVSDNGCSIAPDQLESIFEPFQSTKPQGLGLGLSICRSIIQWHGGRIWAAPNAERGTTVTFSLPIAKEIPEHAKNADDLYRG